MKMIFKDKCGIPKSLPTKRSDGPFIFKTSCNIPPMDVDVVISSDGCQIVATGTSEITSELYSAILDNLPRGAISDGVYEEYKNISLGLYQTINKVFDLIKQELYLFEHRWFTGNPIEWSLDGTVWRIISWGELVITGASVEKGEIDNGWKTRIQHLLNKKEEALLATEHLHEAERTDGLRFQWIEATIAAELAIKEILVSIEPKIKVLLLNLPSPPIHKLYGNVLESITTKRHPDVNIIKKGAELRNDLVHKPESIKLKHNDVFDYINNIRKAIDYLIEMRRDILKINGGT